MSTPADTPQQTADESDALAAQKIVSDLQDDFGKTAPIVQHAIDLIEHKQWIALALLAHSNLAQIEADVSDVTTAVKQVKAGWKTSEFWGYIAVAVLNAYSLNKTGHCLDSQSNALLGGAATAYAAIRAWIKR